MHKKQVLLCQSYARTSLSDSHTNSILYRAVWDPRKGIPTSANISDLGTSILLVFQEFNNFNSRFTYSSSVALSPVQTIFEVDDSPSPNHLNFNYAPVNQIQIRQQPSGQYLYNIQQRCS